MLYHKDSFVPKNNSTDSIVFPRLIAGTHTTHKIKNSNTLTIYNMIPPNTADTIFAKQYRN